MQRWIVLAAFIPGMALAAPQDGVFVNSDGVLLSVTGASDSGFDFSLVAGGTDAGNVCTEGDTSCLQIDGHAEASPKGFTYIDPNDDHSRIFFAEVEAGVRVLSTIGDLGTGTANRMQKAGLRGVYAPMPNQPADAAADGSTGEDEGMAEGIMDFQTPSANIGCEIINSDRYEVRCDMLKLNRSYVTAPTDCEEDWGDSFHVGEHDRKGSLLCHGDTVVYSDSEVLDYGKKVEFGGLTCISEKSGLTCQNAEGHGFTLSRKAQKVF